MLVFLHASRRHEIPASETKDFITDGKSSRYGQVPYFPKSHRANTRSPQWMPVCAIGWVIAQEHTELRRVITMVVSGKSPALCYCRCYLISQAYYANTTVRTGPDKKWSSSPCILGMSIKDMQRHSRPIAACLFLQSCHVPGTVLQAQ